jgi:hypothetical protein
MQRDNTEWWAYPCKCLTFGFLATTGEAGHVARIREKRNVYRLLVGKPEGKRPLGRPRRRWIDNIKMGLLEI